jgi:prepilin-type N-terminal cleavage/methylation domain-containing protein
VHRIKKLGGKFYEKSSKLQRERERERESRFLALKCLESYVPSMFWGRQAERGFREAFTSSVFLSIEYVLRKKLGETAMCSRFWLHGILSKFKKRDKSRYLPYTEGISREKIAKIYEDSRFEPYWGKKKIKNVSQKCENGIFCVVLWILGIFLGAKLEYERLIGKFVRFLKEAFYFKGLKARWCLAFTLAEVLITLAIIGVVAALTIPAVVNKVTKEQYVVGLKKAYNTLKSVERESVQENGEISSWDWSGATSGEGLKNTVERYFVPYFDIMKNCGNSSDKGCWHNLGSIKYLNGTDSYVGYDNGSSRYRFIAADGMMFVFAKKPFVASERLGYLHVDVMAKRRLILLAEIFLYLIYIKIKGLYHMVCTQIITKIYHRQLHK